MTNCVHILRSVVPWGVIYRPEHYGRGNLRLWERRRGPGKRAQVVVTSPSLTGACRCSAVRCLMTRLCRGGDVQSFVSFSGTCVDGSDRRRRRGVAGTSTECVDKVNIFLSHRSTCSPVPFRLRRHPHYDLSSPSQASLSDGAQ